MKSQNKNIAVVIAAVCIALFGLLALQAYLLWMAYNEKEQAFDRSVVSALNIVSQKLESREAAGRVFSVIMKKDGKLPGAPTVRFFSHFPRKDTGILPAPGRVFSSVTTDSTGTRKVTSDGNMIRVEIVGSNHADTSIELPVKKKSSKSGNLPSANSFGYGYKVDSNGLRLMTTIDNNAQYFSVDTSGKMRKDLVTKVVDRLAFFERLPIEQRLSKNDLDSVLSGAMHDAGLALSFHFGVFAGKDSLKISSDSLQKENLRSSTLRSQLFPSDIFSTRYDLAVFFPGRMSFVLGEMFLPLFLSLIFSAVIVISFAATVRTLLQQKRFSVSLVDFINNMTHEFKTPISTVALAAEAIARPDILRNKQRVLKYNSIIVDENSRMRHQVDKILQMAVLEEGEYELKRTDVDMAAVVEQATKMITLQVEQRGGKIIKKLEARNSIVKGDALHLSNIIYNILDNAIKYSPDAPALTVSSSNDGPWFILRVSDKGIGMTPEDVGRVFKKYFRVSTGNTHDVKGFGLGLSYVKLIVEAHQGAVSIDSSFGKGTTVEVRLPIHGPDRQ